MARENKSQQKGSAKPENSGSGAPKKPDTSAKKPENFTPKENKPTEEKGSKKIEKPDHEEWQRKIDDAERELSKANAKFVSYSTVNFTLDVLLHLLCLGQSELQEKFSTARGNNGNNQRREELRKELNSIKEKQQKLKTDRNASQDKIKKLDEQLKAKFNEQKTARSRVPYRSVEEVDREIERLTKEVDSGRMKLVDEKAALSKISDLNRQKKQFPALDAGQKQIDDLKAQIASLKKGGDAPEWKEINEKYDAVRDELDSIRKQQDELFSDPKGLRAQKEQAYQDKSQKLSTVRELKAAFGQAKKAWYDHQNEVRRIRREREAAERAAYEAGRRHEVASRKLEEASAPAYQEEIVMAENVIRYFDPTALPAKETVTQGKFAAVAQRTVDNTGFKGTRVLKKDDDEESYFVGGAGKKAKKGKKAPAESNKFQLSIDIIEQLAKLGVDPPSSQAFVPAVVDKLKDKLEYWKKDQDRKTKEVRHNFSYVIKKLLLTRDQNITKAKKEIEKLEAETNPSAPANMNIGAKDTSSKPAAANQGANGKVNAELELKQENDAAADAAAELERAKLEDAAAPSEPVGA